MKKSAKQLLIVVSVPLPARDTAYAAETNGAAVPVYFCNRL